MENCKDPNCRLFHGSIVQFAYGNKTGEYAVSDFVDALFAWLLMEAARVYWNRNQKSWNQFEDLGIPGIMFRPYYWGEDEEEKAKPNFTFEQVEIYWYKHPFRGMSCNVLMEEKEWVEWFDRCLRTIRDYDARD